jgi:hypothetical protein
MIAQYRGVAGYLRRCARSIRAETFSSMYSSDANGLVATVMARAYSAVCSRPGTSVGANSQIFVASDSSSAAAAN